ncbi:hypothetical protein ABZ135_13400 [Streptomyces sp. NPDC006339]|uniref:hypothetical protein n=1 Tax=Streptomyces sp. NPDC006339 TaxID=3156755 RepID=UPI0033A9E00E
MPLSPRGRLGAALAAGGVLCSALVARRPHVDLARSLGGTGTIRHVINDRGGPSNSATNVANLAGYP